MDVLRTKSIEQSLRDTEDPEFKLKRRLTALDLTVFGVGVIIGAGIFTLTGRVAQANAGPAVSFSFVLAAICCGLAALCYAEFASTVPVSGSAYTFSYATLGELVAWIIGWDLLLEMMLGASVVAQGWASYFETFLDQIGITWPEGLGYGDTFNLPAFLLVAILTALVAYGIKESLRVNLVLVGGQALHRAVRDRGRHRLHQRRQLRPVHPAGRAPSRVAASGCTPRCSSWSPDRRRPTASAASSSRRHWCSSPTSASTSSRPPPRRPRTRSATCRAASSARWCICTILYVAVALVITGMVNYEDINPDAALAQAFIAQGKDGYATLISAGAVAGLTTVVMTLMIGAVRVTFAMSRDNLLPQAVGHVSPKTGTPVRLTLMIGVVVALVASLTPIGQAGGDGQHRHADGVLPGLDRRSRSCARSVPTCSARSRCRLAVAALAVGRDLPVPDDQPDRRDLAPVPGVDGRSASSSTSSTATATAGSAGARESLRRTTRAEPAVRLTTMDAWRNGWCTSSTRSPGSTTSTRPSAGR